MRTTRRNIVRQKNAKREVHIGMNQKAREAVEKVDSCRDGRELFRIAKQSVWEEKDDVGVSCLKDESGGGWRGKV